MDDPRNRLADPDYAGFAWSRYRRLMRWMTLAAVIAVTGALLYLWLSGSFITVHLVIATIAGVGATVLLTAALMGLVFLSSGTGHDADVTDYREGRPPR